MWLARFYLGNRTYVRIDYLAEIGTHERRHFGRGCEYHPILDFQASGLVCRFHNCFSSHCNRYLFRRLFITFDGGDCSPGLGFHVSHCGGINGMASGLVPPSSVDWGRPRGTTYPWLSERHRHRHTPAVVFIPVVTDYGVDRLARASSTDVDAQGEWQSSDIIYLVGTPN